VREKEQHTVRYDGIGYASRPSIEKKNELDVQWLSNNHMEQIKKCYDLMKFFHEIIDDFCNNPLIINAQNTTNVSQYWLSKEVLLQQTGIHVQTLQKIVQNYAKLFVLLANYLSNTKVETNMIEKLSSYASTLIPEKAILDAVVECVVARYEDIKKAATQKALSISQCFLKDFDWKLQLTISSDKISSLREPVLLLNLSLQSNNTAMPQTTELLIELPKSELETVISTLEKINETVQELRV